MNNVLSNLRADSLVLFEDENVIVINKPNGISMHKINSSDINHTIHDIFIDKLAKNDTLRGGIVHRLDKDTSGVVILAKNSESLEFLQKQFAERMVDKSYIALVWGGLKHSVARIELPIKRSLKSPNMMSIKAGGKMSVSEYEVEKEYDKYTLINVKLHTGRTHQIRVQFAYMNHPVVGDALYSKKPLPLGLARQFLHSYRLGLVLPGGTDKSYFEAPLAKDLADFLESLDG